MNKIKVLGNLQDNDSKYVIKIFSKYTEKNNSIVYVDDGYGDHNFSRYSQVTISLKDTELSQTNSFCSKEFHL